MMNRYRQVLVILMAVLLLSSGVLFAREIREDLTEILYPRTQEKRLIEMLLSASWVPGQEAQIPIAGEFFAHFESKSGILMNEGTEEVLGTVRLSLEGLRWLSPYVYETEGEVLLVTDGGERALRMESLDYIYDQDGECLQYRLTCIPDGKSDNGDQAFLICSACQGYCPKLQGTVIQLSEDASRIESMPFCITGRDPFGAECHLQKQVTRMLDL